MLPYTPSPYKGLMKKGTLILSSQVAQRKLVTYSLDGVYKTVWESSRKHISIFILSQHCNYMYFSSNKNVSVKWVVKLVQYQSVIRPWNYSPVHKKITESRKHNFRKFRGIDGDQLPCWNLENFRLVHVRHRRLYCTVDVSHIFSIIIPVNFITMLVVRVFAKYFYVVLE